MKISIIGYGSRGSLYANLFTMHSGVEIISVCDINREKISAAKERLGLADDELFTDEEKFFEQGKVSELLVVSTPDALHTRHALKALELGYDLLLEKPIATTKSECELIYDTATKLNRKVFVCHVLRYAPFFTAIKDELNSLEYGNISTINLTENVAYWHQAHSYVRGSWRRADTSSPMIIAKCCHDLDLISWFIGSDCIDVSSMGSLSFFTEKKAPENSADRCLNCPVKDSCSYDAEKFYINDKLNKGDKGWPVNVLTADLTESGVRRALETGEYGKCVFRCDNDVVDHQVVNMLFGGGITAHLTMTAFSKESYREIHIHCEKGEIYGNMRDNILTCNIFGKESKTIDLTKIQDNDFGHGGGDYRMVGDIVAFYRGKPTGITTEIKHSMQSHLIGFAAEESRLLNGSLIKIK